MRSASPSGRPASQALPVAVQDDAGAHRGLVAQSGCRALRAGDPDEIRALDHRETAVLPRGCREPVQHRLACVGQAAQVQISEGELRELERQPIGAAGRILRDEAALREGNEQTVRGAHRQVQPGGENAEIHASGFFRQRLEHLQRSLDRRDRHVCSRTINKWKGFPIRN
jgi:hypothetical protein